MTIYSYTPDQLDLAAIALGESRAAEYARLAPLSAAEVAAIELGASALDVEERRVAADVLAEVAEGREGMLAAWLDRSPVGWRVIPLVRGHRTAEGYVARLDVLDALVSKTLPPDAISLERAQALMERAQAITRIYSSDALALARRFDDAGCRVDDEITSTARRARAAVLAVLPGVA